MNYSFYKACRFCFCIALLYFSGPIFVEGQAEEFYGAFGSWTNLRQAYPVKGDGISDDTQALQKALDELGDGHHSPVLFIPNGTYRITTTLTMKSRRGIAIVGEDPEGTIIKWDGPAGMKMFVLNGVAYSEYSRITWDGGSKALAAVAHEWDRKTGPANSGTRHTDEIFRNLLVGLKSGANMDAEFSIRRCRFYNCSSTAISLQGWNALDWWIWDCYFEDCNEGVANDQPSFGAGNFHVYRSIFKNSRVADISIGNSNHFSFRNNISYNSNAFIRARQFSNTSPLTIQGNLVINGRNLVLADLFTKGNILFLDNTFITPDSNRNYAIQLVDNYTTPAADGALVGNAFTATGKIILTEGGRLIQADNSYGIKPGRLPALNPSPFAPLARYPVIEVDNTMSSTQIQQIIDKASGRKKQIIHFAYGEYQVRSTFHIPSGSALILCGDALASILQWKGDSGQSVIRLSAPARATLRNLMIRGAKTADGIFVEDDDRDGNVIYAEELLAYGGRNTNILVNGFAHTDIRFENLHHNYCSGDNSVEMRGRNEENASFLKIFGCVSLDNRNSYCVQDKGRIAVYDSWFESGGINGFLHLKGSGDFILSGAHIANTNAGKFPFIDIDSFSGKVVLAEVILNQPGKRLGFSNGPGTADLLVLGALNWSDSTTGWYDIHSKTDHYSLRNNRYNIGKGSYPLPDAGDTSVQYLEKMLAPLRSVTVEARHVFPARRSHFTIDRVMIEGGVNNLRIERMPEVLTSRLGY
jgi:hypothetical protein